LPVLPQQYSKDYGAVQEQQYDVVVDSLTRSLFAAIFPQALLKAIRVSEGRAANYYNAKQGSAANVMRFFQYLQFSVQFTPHLATV
jgi:hypothetical protein